MQTLQTFEFHDAAQAKYPWDEILSGQVVVLQKGRDYDRDREAFKTSIRIKANGRGLGIHLTSFDAGSEISKKYKLKGEGLVVQAYPGTPEQIEEWTKQAAARKHAAHVKAKAKRAAAKAAKATATPNATTTTTAA